MSDKIQDNTNDIKHNDKHNDMPDKTAAPNIQDISEDQDKKEEVLAKDNSLSELGKTIFFAILLALIIRTLFFEPFNIPSGSMKPTLLIGDYLFVSKTSYGYSKYSFPVTLSSIEGRVWGDAPQRGDIAVFKLPSDPSTHYIKRIIGLPGDTIQVIAGRLYINGQLVERKSLGYETVTDRFGNSVSMIKYQEILPNGVEHLIYEEGDDLPLDNTRPYYVPDDHVFMMGDNRDNSRDSRVLYEVGPIPIENLIGRANMLFFSSNGDVPIWKIWAWPWGVRYERVFQSILPYKQAGHEA